MALSLVFHDVLRTYFSRVNQSRIEIFKCAERHASYYSLEISYPIFVSRSMSDVTRITGPRHLRTKVLSEPIYVPRVTDHRISRN